jgi:hypothetical protein
MFNDGAEIVEQPVLAKIANSKGIPEQILSDSLLQLRRQRGR